MNKIKIEKEQTDEQLVSLVKTLLSTLTGREFDGFTAARYFMEKWNIYGDHHLFTEIMDYMTRTGGAVCTQGWGQTKYRIS